MRREGYRQKIVRAGKTVDVQYTYPTQFGEGLTRAHHKEGAGTPADMEAYNYELAVIKLTQIINANFGTDDWFITLHYEKDRRPPDLETARKQLSVYFAKLKKEYEKLGIEFRWVKTTAYGPRGGIHHHIVIPGGIKMQMINKLWRDVAKLSHEARPPECRALYSTGEYSSLAAYFCQQAEKSGVKEKHGRKFTCSRNIKRPVPEEPRWVDKVKWNEPPVAWPGYYIETDSIRAGCNPVTGRPYLFYRMVKIQPNFTCYDENGKKLVGKEAVSYYRRTNKEYIKQNWFTLNPEGEVIFKTEGVKQNE